MQYELPLELKVLTGVNRRLLVLVSQDNKLWRMLSIVLFKW